MPGLPGGLVTLQQYLDANQPAVQQTQAALDQKALQPYQQALQSVTGQVQGAATQAAAQAQQTAQTQAANQARNRAIAGSRQNPNDPSTGTASIPYSSALSGNPGAQATLAGAQATLNDAAAKAGQMTGDASNRQNALYSMYGTAAGSAPYSLGDAGLDAALTTRTAAPAGAGSEVQSMINASPTTTGTATSTVTGQYEPATSNGPGEGPVEKPRRTWEQTSP